MIPSFDEKTSFCERCCHYFSPNKESRITVKEPNKFSRTLVLCPKCMGVIRDILFTPKSA